MTPSESEIQAQIAEFIKMRYPEVVFHSDFGSGTRLRPYQAKMQKIQNGGRRAWPDLFIAEPVPRCIGGSWDHEWHGLFIELKRDKTRLKKRNGEWASEHIAEQANVLQELRERGYYAVFAVGYREAIDTIIDYLESGGFKCQEQ